MKFNVTRFTNLLRRDFITHKKGLLLAMLSTVGFLLFIYFIGRVTGSDDMRENDFWENVYVAFLFIAGSTFTSVVFREFRSPAGRLQFLSLPASNLEKLGSRWLYSLVLFPAFITLAVWLISTISITHGPGMFAGIDREDFKWILVGFVILHATILMYAVWFNNLVLLKGTMFGFVTLLVFGLLCGGFFWIVFHGLFENGLRYGPSLHVNMSPEARDFFEYTIFPIGKTLLIFFVAPFYWIVSYLKMKEKEA